MSIISELSVPFNSSFFALIFCGSLTKLLIGILLLTFKGDGFFLNIEQRHLARAFPLQKLIALESWSKMMGTQQKLCAKVQDVVEEMQGVLV